MLTGQLIIFNCQKVLQSQSYQGFEALFFFFRSYLYILQFFPYLYSYNFVMFQWPKQVRPRPSSGQNQISKSQIPGLCFLDIAPPRPRLTLLEMSTLYRYRKRPQKQSRAVSLLAVYFNPLLLEAVLIPLERGEVKPCETSLAPQWGGGGNFTQNITRQAPAQTVSSDE